MEVVGHISQSVIDILGLKIASNAPVFIGETNIEHIKTAIHMNTINIL